MQTSFCLKIMSSVKKYLKAHARNTTGIQCSSFCDHFQKVFRVYVIKGAITPTIILVQRAENYSSLFFSILTYFTILFNLRKLTVANSLGFVRVSKF